MTTPFPGMDPYWEHPGLWPDFHNNLIAAMRDDLAPRLRPKYYVAIEERTYVTTGGSTQFAGRSDVAIAQPPSTTKAITQTVHQAAGSVVSVEVPVPDEITETYLEVRSTESSRVITVIKLLSHMPLNNIVHESRSLSPSGKCWHPAFPASAGRWAGQAGRRL